MPPWSYFGERAQLGRSATKLYGSIVAQARDPTPYRDLGVPDTPEARLEMLLLHLALVLLRLKCEGTTTERLARALTEAFVSDMDACMREMGIGDLSVPRHVKKAVAALYERMRDYGAALAGPEEALGRLVAAHLFAGTAAAGAAPLAAMVRAVSRGLARQLSSDLLAGRVAFPAWPRTDDAR
jgi:cytochrome b pre-mRNA-processing protein 3